jgi:hypothetical protein
VPPTPKAKGKLRHVETRIRAQAYVDAPIALLNEDHSHVRFLGADEEAGQSGIAIALIANPAPHIYRDAGPDDAIL